MACTRSGCPSRHRVGRCAAGRGVVGLAAVVALAALPLLAACSDSSDQGKPKTNLLPTETSSPSVKASSAAVPTDLCATLTKEEIADAIGAPVTLNVGPSGDCEFAQGDARALQGSFGAVVHASENGGYDTYLAGMAASFDELTKTPIVGLGERAVAFTGLPKMGSGENFMGGGVIDHGSYLVQVTLVQGNGMARAHLVAAAERLLRVIDTASR